MLPLVYQTPRFSLQAYRKTDEDCFVAMFLDPSLSRFMDDSLADAAEARNFFAKIFEVYASTAERWFWIWGIYEGEKLCGHLELKETHHTGIAELEVVYLIHAAERRRGIMTEVLALLKRESRIWQRQIIATVDPANTPSIALLQKWGIAQQEWIQDSETGDQYYKMILLK